MRRMNWVVIALMVGLFAIAVRGASSTTKPSSATTKPAGGRLFAPYSKMNSLSDDQREQIETIHHKMLADEKEIEAKETSDIMALLNDDQKKEVREIEEKSSSDKKSKTSSKKEMN